MSGPISLILLACLALLLVAAAYTDLRARIISNRLNLAIAVLAVPYWFAAGIEPWPGMMWQVAAALAVFVLFATVFALGAMGGGDVKMVAAVALWLPAQGVLHLLMIMSLAGGAITLFMLVRHRLARAEGGIEVPYGVAIAFAGLCLVSERILYQFA